jgi:muramidase (phage lysozyme)
MRRLFSFVSLTILVAGCSSVPAYDGTSDSELNEGEGVEVGTLLRVTATLLNLREGPSMEDRIIGAPLEQGSIVTCIETSGEQGWVRVQAQDGRKGWVHSAYVIRADNRSGLGPRSGATCEPSRAQGAVPQVHKAFHDMIAFAEGTRGRSKDGYDIMFGGRSFASCAKHPDQCHSFGNTCSTAAGRYQFLTKTWNSTARALDLADFEPESQELGTAYLIKTARRVNLPADRPLTSAEFDNALSKLSYEWASLPPNRYGQPNKTKQELWQVYCEGAGCR